ncbi:protease modulator HflC [Aureimonas phyllosphaerae]|uniref:Protein HflC n=1 Tax=Aureimonas phyllosphaerae TaxID=1166078 RepID=A0A7W6C198_9HYPH|nr:protease modulator HflC [Aureimonas phyllosphaerae]MBB3936597.1 membrane protease subunit HflC [Aureimonas phyllosphaerae]MBB3960539.1 membrane protease subunit HflC [Aureimonas phyllosphaerae]SFF24338.1 protease FtsH subunit HflC [Aureimonas phyllosphaerae]
MSNRVYASLAVVLAALFVLYNSVFIVREGNQAVVTRFGQIQRVVTEPGLYFKLPLNFAGADNIQVLPNRLLRLDLDNMRVQVSGGAFYIVDAFLVYRINDAARFRQAVSGSVDQAEQRLRNRFDAAVRRVYGLRNFESALSEERAQMMVEVRDQIRPDATQLGIDLVDVRIRRTDLTDDVSQQTFARMRAERLAEAERVRARGRVSAREIRAATDRSVSETVAGARRDAEVLQGEGEAERSSIFANAYQRDPEFFQFYRAMQAYRTALENGGTTMLLRPDSEFFRYFDNAGGPGVAPGSAPTASVSPEAPAAAPAATPAPPAAAAAPVPAAPAATPAAPAAPALAN